MSTFGKARNYYGSALSNAPSDDEVWSSGEYQTQPYAGSLFKTAAGVGAVYSAGFVPLGNGKRIWDYYVGGMRAFEEYFFMGIPRTMQLSNIFSRYETAATSKRTITPEQFKKFPGKQLEYLEKLTGRNAFDIAQQGLVFENGKLSLLESGETILEHARVIRNVSGSPRFTEGYARSLGVDLPHRNTVFSHGKGVVGDGFVPFTNAEGKEVSELFAFTGGHTRGQALRRDLSGIGTELVERANRLAKAGFESPVLSPILKKLPFEISLGVKPGSGLQTLGRLTGQFAIAGGAIAAGYGTANWALRNTIGTDLPTIAGGIYANAHIAAARIADVTGLSKIRQWQEEVAPGSTSLTTLSAFPLMGALTGGGVHWAQRLITTWRMQARGRELVTASKRAYGLMKRFEGRGLASTIGRFLRQSRSESIRAIGKSRVGVMMTLGAGLGAIPILPFLPGALLPGKSADQLEEEYSGRKEVAIRKSRFWEFGRTPYEGTSIDYYRPNWYARMKQHGKEEQIWGPLGGEPDPFRKFIIENFTYDLERAHYYDRPFPVTGRPFMDVPIVGPLLSATLGQIVKPQILMHQDEFVNQNGDYLQMPAGFGSSRATHLGETLPGSPINSAGPGQMFGEQMYRMTELSGLPGFLFGTFKKAITGSETFGEDTPVLQSADTMTSLGRGFEEASVGGMALTNELFRRIFPTPRNIEQYNPIRNTMPEWMPGPGERGPDFQHGDPFQKVAEGEIRLPGAGYETRYPELEGLKPNQYPLIHRYKILADVAPYSESFQYVEKQIMQRRNAEEWSDYEEYIYQQVAEQKKAKRQKKEFTEKQYSNKSLTPWASALEEHNEREKQPINNSWFARTVGRYWEFLSHDTELPIEMLTPVSPYAKLVHKRTAVEDYERMQVWGTQNAFWDRPWANFIRPFLTSTAHVFGWNEIPDHVEKQRNIEEYFDMLQYLKFTRLKGVAEQADDWQAVKDFEQRRRETLTGIDPYTYDYTEVFRALPRRDRDYFNSFASTDDQEERAKILSMVPDDEKGLLVAKWRQKDVADYESAKKKGVLSNREIEKGEELKKAIQEDRPNEGFPKTKELWAEYLGSRLDGESYPDWYRRTKLIPERASELGFRIPGPDWVGFNPAVDLDDVKLKYIQSIDESPQDYNLWPSRTKSLRNKEAFINEDTIEPMIGSDSVSETKYSIQRILEDHNVSNYRVDVEYIGSGSNVVELDLNEDRTQDVRHHMQRG